MKNERIEQELRTWFDRMLAKYVWLSIKFEFNLTRQCFMVSFSPETIISQSKDFCEETLAFEDKLNDEYGDDAPLFCDEESLFKLSSNAEVLTNNDTIELSKIDLCGVFAKVSYNEVEQDTIVMEVQYNDQHRIAA